MVFVPDFGGFFVDFKNLLRVTAFSLFRYFSSKINLLVGEEKSKMLLKILIVF